MRCLSTSIRMASPSSPTTSNHQASISPIQCPATAATTVASTLDLTVPEAELQKIESFYQSFGTLLYIAKSSADLYTIPNVHLGASTMATKVTPIGRCVDNNRALNRNSIATSSSFRTPNLADEEISIMATTDINDESIVLEFFKHKL